MSRTTHFKRSAGRFLRQIFHRPKAKISRGSLMILTVLIILFFSALLLRLEPLMNAQPIVRAFDPWFQLKVTHYIVDNGFPAFFNWYDYNTWIPYGRDMTSAAYLGVPFTSAFFYFILSGLGIAVDVTMVSVVLPAFMGALTVIVSFFWGREMYNNVVGMLTALFMAYIPAFIQRTVAGFYDNECIGVFAIVLTMYFFTRSMKKDSLSSSFLSGLSLAFLIGTWGAANFLVDLFAMYAFFMLVFGKYSRRLLTTYLITISIAIFVGGLVPRVGYSDLASFSMLVPIGVGALLALYEIWTRIGTYREATSKALAPHMKPLLLGIIAPIAGVSAYFLMAGSSSLDIRIYNTNPIVTIGGKFLTVINPFYRLEQRIFASVAEHLPSPWGSFYYTLNVLIFLFPLGMYFLFKRGRDEDWLAFLYGLTAVYFTGSMIRLSLILAPGVALLSAISVNSIISPFSKVFTQKSIFERRRFRTSSSLTSEHAVAAFFFIGMILSVNVFLGTTYATAQVGNPEFSAGTISSGAQFTDWQTAMTFVRNVLPSTSVIASWWDYGYWINGAGNGRTIVDNATFNSTQIALMGYAMMSLNLTESLRTFKHWNTTHVLVYWGHRYSNFGGDEGKWPWMVRIAEDKLGSKMIDDATYLDANENTLDAFYQSTLYKLMLYNEPHDDTEGQQMGLTDARRYMDNFYYKNGADDPWVSHIPDTLYGAFNLVFTSSEYGTVKIYEIDYTMYDQYLNMTQSDIPVKSDSLANVQLDGEISSQEAAFSSYNVVFGGGYEATVYTRANSSHIYYGIEMNNFVLGADSFGLQIAPQGDLSTRDIRAVDYQGNDYYDGHTRFDGTWAMDSTGSNSSEVATGNRVIEFLLPLNKGSTPQDVPLVPGDNYQIRFLFWNNIQSGEPTFASDWSTIWIPVELH
jgi:dolichyl-diphosphooligosaccharide--protein glycosyltransferase